MKEYSIYFIYNQANGKLYVGASNNADKRWRQHKQTAVCNRKNYYIYNAINKHGIDKFLFKVVETVSSYKHLMQRVVEWISVLKENGYLLYNITNGGEGTQGLQRFGSNNANYGKPMKQHVKDILSPFIHLKGKDNPLFGKKRPKNIIAKIVKKKQPLSDEKMAEMKSLYATGEYTQVYITKKYKIANHQAHAILRNKIFNYDENIKPIIKKQLTKEIVEEMRQLYTDKKYNQIELAAKYNISMSQINNIICKRQWK